MAKVPPIELLEEWYPVRFARYELRPGSAGAGMHRGGLGVEYELVVEADRVEVSFLMDRGKRPPAGIAGGGDALGTVARIVRSNGDVEVPEHLTKDQDIVVHRGDRIVVQMPGGGGYGDEAERDPELIERDRRAGYL
jgi:N-methylhydantoinase B